MRQGGRQHLPTLRSEQTQRLPLVLLQSLSTMTKTPPAINMLPLLVEV